MAKQIKDLNVDFVSLVKKGANKTKFSIIKCGDVETAKLNVAFLKFDEKRIVTGLVYEPNKLDSHDHFMKEEEIEQAAFSFMNNQSIDREHSFKKENCQLVESWISKEDFKLGETEIKKGSWLISIKVNDEKIWSDIKKGELTGFSLAGSGKLIDDNTITKGDDDMEKIKEMIKKSDDELNVLKTQIEEVKKNGSNAMLEMIEKQIEPINKSIEDIKKNNDVKELKAGLEKADKLIKDLQLNMNINKSTQDITDDDIYGIFGEAFATVQKSNMRAITSFEDVISQIEKSDNVITKALNTTDQPATVKPFYINKILEKVLEINPIIKEVPFITITDNSIYIPKETSGFIEAGWVDESGARVETAGPTTTNVEIKLYQIYAMPKITNKLLATNYVGLGNFIMSRIQKAINQKISDAVLFGTGPTNSQPMGIFENPVVKAGLIPVTAANFNLDAFLQATFSLISAYDSGAKWYMNKNTWATLLSLKDQAGAYLHNSTNAIARAEQTLWGFPVVFIDSIPAFSDITIESTPFALFGNVKMGMQGAKNNKLNISIQDQVTEKGFTKMYVETGIGFEVVDEQAFTGLKFTLL